MNNKSGLQTKHPLKNYSFTEISQFHPRGTRKSSLWEKLSLKLEHKRSQNVRAFINHFVIQSIIIVQFFCVLFGQENKHINNNFTVCF